MYWLLARLLSALLLDSVMQTRFGRNPILPSLIAINMRALSSFLLPFTFASFVHFISLSLS